jgi:cell division protein FtsN
MRSQSRRSENKIGRQVTALGVIGFLALAGVFFLLGLFCIGPMIRSHMPQKPGPQTVYNPPAHRNAEQQAQPQEEQQPLDIQITEQGREQSTAEDQATSGDEGVQQDGNSLTITLEPKSNDSQPAEKPAPKPVEKPAEAVKPPKTSPPHQETTSIEKPRASTETTHSVTPSDQVYRVQAGTFASRTNAENLAEDLKSRGYHPEIKSVGGEGNTLYRVQLGGYKTQDGAKKLAKDLTDDGYNPTMITEKAE